MRKAEAARLVSSAMGQGTAWWPRARHGAGNNVAAQGIAWHGGRRGSVARRPKGRHGRRLGTARARAIVHWAWHGQGSAAEGEARLRSKGRTVR
jgi:hypothetical protein